MFSLLSRSIYTATRLDGWNAPDHRHQPQTDDRDRRQRNAMGRAPAPHPVQDRAVETAL